MTKKILVTGGAGFIGSHLCKKLVEQGNEVICLDNLFTGSVDNIRELIGNSNFTFLKKDVIEPIDIEVDQIYNLACPASPIHYQDDPVRTVTTSFMGALNMLNLAKKVNARILQASTSEVYGDPLEHPQTEKYVGNVNPIGVRACYDEGKRVAETLFFDFHRQHNVNIRVIRIFNTYGPNMAVNDGRVVSNFITQALLDEDITIYGDGTQTRSFCYVSDLVDAMIKFMAIDDPTLTGPVNIGNPTELEIREIAECILKKINSKSNIIYKPLPQDDPHKRKPCIDYIKSLIDWEPKVDLDNGLDKTIEFFSRVLWSKK